VVCRPPAIADVGSSKAVERKPTCIKEQVIKKHTRPGGVVLKKRASLRGSYFFKGDFMYTRCISVLGEDAVLKLKSKHVVVFGLGGVGGYAVEALCRTGVGKLTLVDGDVYTKSNLNRQIGATTDTIGRLKTEVMRERILSINPDIEVNIISEFYSDGADLFCDCDYIIDAIDPIREKTKLIYNAYKCNIPLISAMGTGNKTDPSKLEFADIFKTVYCPLARKIRKNLKELGVKKQTVLFSREIPKVKERTPGSVVWVPACAGLMIAGYVVDKLTK